MLAGLYEDVFEAMRGIGGEMRGIGDYFQHGQLLYRSSRHKPAVKQEGGSSTWVDRPVIQEPAHTNVPHAQLP
ncbi:hypothetical protein D3C79_870980 [compost metagenome]